MHAHAHGRGEPDDVHAFGQAVGDALRDLDVLLLEQPVAAHDDGHLRTERVEDVGHLAGDEPATEDDEALGDLVDPHDRVGCVVGDEVEPRQRRHVGPGPGGEDEPVRRDLLTADLQRLGPHEPGVLFEDGHVREADAVLAAAGGDRVDAAERTIADIAPSHVIEGGVDAEAGALADVLHDVGGVDQHLGRDAPDVQARAAEGAALDDRHVPVVEAVIENAVARAGSDDAEIEVLVHGRSPYDRGARAVAAWYRSAAGGPGRGWGQAEYYSASLRWSQVMATQPGMTGNQNVSMRNRSTAATARSDDNPIAVRPPM